ncbi:MAG: acetoacetate decarboxylase family protein [Spirochaetota bacterium]
MRSNDFFNVPLENFSCSKGQVDLPIQYFDTSLFMGLYLVASDAVKDTLLSQAMKPVILPGGKTLVGIIAFEYRDTSIGSYNEVGLAALCVPKHVENPLFSLADIFKPSNSRDLGFFIIDLPVTTEIALAAGKEYWNYPKFVAQIPLEYRADYVNFSVRDPNGSQNIMSMKGDFQLGVSLPVFDLLTYTNHTSGPSISDGSGSTQLKTLIRTKGDLRYYMYHDVTLEIGNSTHAMAKNLRKLDLDGKRPFVLAESHDFLSLLHKGVPV